MQNRSIAEVAAALGVGKTQAYAHLRLLRLVEEGLPEPGSPKSVSWKELTWGEDPWAQAFRNRNPEGATLEEIGAEIGVTLSRVRVIERRALLKLKLAGADLRSFLADNDVEPWDPCVVAAR